MGSSQSQSFGSRLQGLLARRKWLAAGAMALIAGLGAVASFIPRWSAPRGDSPQVSRSPQELVGRWERLRPVSQIDTLDIASDGSAAGAFTAKFQPMGRIVRWRLGSTEMDFGMLCLASNVTSYCTGYRVIGDTLSLADDARSAFLRVRADRSAAERERIRREASTLGTAVTSAAPTFGNLKEAPVSR